MVTRMTVKIKNVKFIRTAVEKFEEAFSCAKSRREFFLNLQVNWIHRNCIYHRQHGSADLL